MNCRTFQTILQDLGKDASLDLQTRQDSLAHAEVCPNCAALLRDECRLTAGLNVLAASLADAEASPRIEAALLNAFRARGIKQETEVEAVQTLLNSPAANNRPVTPFPSPQLGARGEYFSLGRRSRVWHGWPARIAAVGLLAAGLAAWLSWQGSNTKPDEVADRMRPSSPTAMSETSPPKVLLPQTAGTPEVERSHSVSPKARSRPTARKLAVRVPQPHRIVRQSDLQEPYVENYAGFDQSEVATEFFPLSYGEPMSSSLEGGQLVRVQLPRTTLLSFGFPMSQERAPEPIKADVLVGEDGLARAIRFVH
jgi:hypothetical protein